MFLFALVSISLAFAVSYGMNSNNASEGSEIPSQNNLSDLPEEPPELVIPEEPPELVVPESPIGTLGLIGAFSAAFGMFVIIHKRK